MVNSPHKGVVGAATRDGANMPGACLLALYMGCLAALSDETYRFF